MGRSSRHLQCQLKFEYRTSKFFFGISRFIFEFPFYMNGVSDFFRTVAAKRLLLNRLLVVQQTEICH
jgi:hypothetical protein